MDEITPQVNLSETDLNDFHAKMGQPLKTGTPVATESMVIEALKTVQDPELMLDIYSLGLVYKIDIMPDGNVNIEMTLTSPTCPMGPEMIQMAAHAVASVVGVGKVKVNLTFDPPWTTDKLSDEIKLMMGI